MRPPSRLVGVDIQASALAQAKGRLGGDHAELVNADFFSTTPDKLGRFDAVVGNPPFIRFHRFSGMSRARALGVAKAAGVKLTALSSAWAPFLVHAAQFVQPGGRLAMVAPMELLHAAYALPVLRYLCDCFARTVVLTFERRLFPDLSQDTVLVLGSCRAGQGRGLDLLSLKDPWQLETLLAVDPLLRAGRSLPVEPLVSGQQRALQYLLPDATRRLYVSLQAEGLSARLGEWLAVSIGYVTGNNSFFHFSAAKAEELGLEARNLRRVLRRAEEIRGLAYTESDWLAARAADAECYVLSLDAEDGVLPPAVSAYIREGERKGNNILDTASECGYATGDIDLVVQCARPGSSAGSERLATTKRVEGSSPSRATSSGQSSHFVHIQQGNCGILTVVVAGARIHLNDGIENSRFPRSGRDGTP